MVEKLDILDREILRILEIDAKTGAKTIAQRLGLTKTPVYERIKRLEKEGFIKNYVAVLDTNKIESGITVFSQVSLDAQKGSFMDEFLERVSDFKEVTECYVVGGDFDFLLKVTVKDLDTYYNFAKSRIASLPNIGSVKSAFVLNEAKHSHGYPLL